jgi:pimeloyl-[acyl-carrier protein] methyl ester esterase
MPWYTGSGGQRLWYEERGTGRPLVLLHGWCMSSAVWKDQLEGLSGMCRVIAVDLRGHGQSPVPEDGFSAAGCRADLAGLFAALDLRCALLAGWSLGSMVALDAFPDIRDRLSGLVLVAATPRFTTCDGYPHGLSPREVDGMSEKLGRSMRRALEGFTGLMFTAGERDDRTVFAGVQELLSGLPLPEPAVARQGLAMLAGTDLRGRLPMVDLPTMVLNGDSDRICLPQASDFLARQISSSQHVVFAGCGHAPFLTQVSRFNRCIGEFIGMVNSDN